MRVGETPTVDVVLPERLDVSTVGDVRDLLHLAVTAGPTGDLVVDVSQVEVMDAAGLGLLVSMHRTCFRLGGRLVLVDPQPRVLRLLAVTRLHRVLHLDRDSARPGALGA
jgi:anti-sigma B factor antagonist